MLAYTVALDLPEGTLIYAADTGVGSAEHLVLHANKRLRVVTIDLAAHPSQILGRIDAIARTIGIELASPAVA